MTDRQIERAIAALCALTAVNAFGGAVYGLRGAVKVPVGWLEGSPFHSYRIPSVILGVAVGRSSATAAACAWRGNRRAAPAAVTAGAILTGWIAAQLAIIGRRSFLQPVMAGVGIALIGLGRRLA